MEKTKDGMGRKELRDSYAWMETVARREHSTAVGAIDERRKPVSRSAKDHD